MTIYTIGEVAKILNVQTPVAKKWFDSGKLRGYRIPGTHIIKIPQEHLKTFLRNYGFSEVLKDLEKEA